MLTARSAATARRAAVAAAAAAPSAAGFGRSLLLRLRPFSASSAAMAPVKVGDKLPSGTVEYYDKEDNKQKVDVAQWAAGKKVVIFGIPGAFTPVCSSRHLPGFMEASEQLKQKGIQELACLSVNDPFVMKAWGKDYTGLADKIVLLADGTCSYTKALGFEADLSDAGLGIRCRRFSLMADDGVIKQLSLEEGGEFNVSSAEDLLKAL